MRIAPIAAPLLLAAVSCAGKADAGIATGTGGAAGGVAIACGSDAQCGSSGACVSQRCVERLDNIGAWGVEIAPQSNSGSKVTEVLSVGPRPVVLTASAELQLDISFVSANQNAAVPPTASVILTVPSDISGRPERSFQANFMPGSGTATVSIPDAIRARPAMVTLIPLSPSDLKAAPNTFTVTVPATGNALAPLQVPLPSLTIRGQLVDALNYGKGNFNARAFQQKALVSTTDTTSATDAVGSFTLFFPPGAVNGVVSVDLVPNGSASDPWITLAGLTLSQAPIDLGAITLPAYAAPNDFRVTVHGDDPGQTPVDDASIRAFTTFSGGDARGTTKFLRDGNTDAGGTAQLSLIPGDSLTARNYSVSVVPPPGSPWKTQCVTSVPVLWNGSTTPTIQDFALARRPVMSGRLLSWDGAPVANAVVTATRGTSAASSCLPGPATTSVTTDGTGAFALALDSGDGYQLDYDPPNGLAVPRWTEYDISVNGDLPRNVLLPAPALFEGDVKDANGKTLEFTTIRIFEPRQCPTTDPCSRPPMLRGQTQSDATGHFRAIVAAP